MKQKIEDIVTANWEYDNVDIEKITEQIINLFESYSKSKMIIENKSLLEMAKLHMDNRAVIEFKKQVRCFKVEEVVEPKTYLKWYNTEDGRDISECYERIVIGSEVFYVNCMNRNKIISKENSFYFTLDAMYIDFKLTLI